MASNIWEGTVTGATSGAIAGLTVYGVRYFHEQVREACEMRRVNAWLKENSTGSNWRE